MDTVNVCRANKCVFSVELNLLATPLRPRLLAVADLDVLNCSAEH